MLTLWLHCGEQAVAQMHREAVLRCSGDCSPELLCMQAAPCCFRDCILGQAAHRTAMWRWVAVHENK